MSAGDSQITQPPVVSAVAVAHETRVPAKWLGAGAVVVVAVLVTLGSVWLTHARALQDFGNEWTAPGQPGHTLYSDMAIYPRSNGTVTVDITDVRPRVTTNTADATIEVLTCTSAGSERIGVIQDDIDDYCTTAPPWRSGPITIGSDTDTYLVLAITPGHTGRVTIDGADVSFRTGIRSGTQHAGISTVVEVP